jgi:hypothetical protein
MTCFARHELLLLYAAEKKRVVRGIQNCFPVVSVLARPVLAGPAERKTELRNKCQDLLCSQLNRLLHWLLSVVPKKRSNVDPKSSSFEHSVDRLQVVKNILGRVNKETSNDDIPLLYRES